MSFSLHYHMFPTAHDQELCFPCQQVCKIGVHFDSLYTGIGILYLLVLPFLTSKQIPCYCSNYFFFFFFLPLAISLPPGFFFVPTVARVSFGVFFDFTLFFLFLKLFTFTYTTAGIGYTITYASQTHFSRIQTGSFSINSSNVMQSLPTVRSTIIFPSLILFWQHNRALSFQQ